MAKSPLRLIVHAASGRMGSLVAGLAAKDPRFVLAGCVFREGGSRLEADAHGAPAFPPDTLEAHLRKADAVIDFSAPDASVLVAAAAARARKAAVIGTTGFSTAQRVQLERSAKKAPLLVSPNFSFAVNLLFWLAGEAARRLPDYDAAIVETHHTRKKDAPSGTAMSLARAVVDARQNKNPVPTSSLRLGDVVGDHTLTLAGPYERLELTHRAHARSLFARGALEAALWTANKRPGLYDMPDMLGLK